MTVRRDLLSLKASHSKNFPALNFIIQSIALKPNSWQEWKNKVDDKISIYDDGRKLNYKFEFKDNFDLFKFAKLSDIIKFSNIIIAAKRAEVIKLWLLGNDNVARYFEFNNAWESKHLFSESPALVFNIINMFLGNEDKIPHLFQIEDYMILTAPFDDIDDKNNNFIPLWKELGA